jgi:hypothetical protein
MKIFVVIRDIGKEESDVELVKAFVSHGRASGFMDTQEEKLTSAQTNVFYSIEEIELVEE